LFQNGGDRWTAFFQDVDDNRLALMSRRSRPGE